MAFPKSEDLEFRMGMEVPADATNNMIANHVLSKSKDMPVPDELFDQVKIWESRRHLEEAKCALKTESLFCSRQTSFELCDGPPLQNQGSFTRIYFSRFALWNSLLSTRSPAPSPRSPY